MTPPYPPPPEIKLPPEVWRWPAYRHLPPLMVPVPRPFDVETARKRLERVLQQEHGASLGWKSLSLPLAVDEDEAGFWLRAFLQSHRFARPAALARHLSTGPGEIPTLDAVVTHALESRVPHAGWIWRPLLALHSVEIVVTWVLTRYRDLRRSYAWAAEEELMGGFREDVVPYLTPETRERLREAVAPYLPRPLPSPDVHESLPVALAAALGAMPAVMESVRQAPDGTGTAAPDWLWRVLSLDDPQEALHHAERLRLLPESPPQAQAWLAYLDFAGVPGLQAAVLAQKRKTAAAALMQVLGTVHHPSAVAPMVTLLARSAAPDSARRWLQRHRRLALPELARLAATRGKVADAAQTVLRSLAATEGTEVILRRLEYTPGTAQAAALLQPNRPVAAAPLPNEFRQAADNLTPADRPTWIRPVELPPLLLEGEPLPEEAVMQVLAALRRSTLDSPHPLVELLRRRGEVHTREAFVLKLHELWEQQGSSTREIWAMAALGLLGADACALRLGALARTYREKLRHQPAALALACLRTLGSNTALVQLRAFTRIPRDWSLKEVAQQYLAEAAQRRGWSLEELDDLTVPHCGLDGAGQLRLDYGSRGFNVVLMPDLRPRLRDDDGRLRDDLPRPGKQDDPSRAAAAAAAWKRLKKQLQEVQRNETRRLQEAMVQRRTWNASTFRTVFLQHPVMGTLARGLVWNVASPGKEAVTFRIAEDLSPADRHDELMRLPDDGTVTLPHPVDLTPEERAFWLERMVDYELTPPFPQLNRPVYPVEPDEREQVRLTRFQSIACMAIALVDGLERRGWMRAAADRICHHRAFPRAHPRALIAVATYTPGIYPWSLTESPLQHVSSVEFFTMDAGGAPRGNALPMQAVDPVVFSECCMDLAALTYRSPAGA